MEYSLDALVDLIRQSIYNNFPYDPNSKNGNIRDIAFMNNPLISVDFGTDPYRMFDIGNEFAERTAPYYHILQDAQVIRKSGRGTKRSKGSQAKVEEISKRDYGKVSFNEKSKTFYQEYHKNIRGQRSKASSATRFIKLDGKTIKINRDSDYYLNIHYNYIDKILDENLPIIAETLGLKLRRKIDTGLKEENDLQGIDNMISFFSEMEE